MRVHGGLAIRMLDRDMVACPVARVAGVEHDAGLDGADRRTVRRPKVQSRVVPRPHAVLAEVSTDDTTRHRQDGPAATGATGTAGTVATRPVGPAATGAVAAAV